MGLAQVAIDAMASARFATVPAPDECEVYDGAKVSQQVTFQAKARPLFHGMIVTPSARLLSDLQRPTGSKTGMSAAVSD